MKWKQLDCTCKKTNRNFGFGRIWIAPANARIETLRHLTKILAFQLKGNDLEAFGLHQPMHQLKS
jgi:hypothetical protein